MLDQLGLKFQPLTEVAWTVYRFKSPLLRLNQIDEASVRVDRIVFGKHLSVAEIESVRSILSALRSRRLMRGKTAKAN